MISSKKSRRYHSSPSSLLSTTANPLKINPPRVIDKVAISSVGFGVAGSVAAAAH